MNRSVSITADSKGVTIAAKEAQKSLASIPDHKDTKLDADIKLAEANLDKLKLKLTELEKQPANAKVNADTAVAMAQMTVLEERIKAMTDKKHTITINTDVDTLGSKFTKAGQDISKAMDVANKSLGGFGKLIAGTATAAAGLGGAINAGAIAVQFLGSAFTQLSGLAGLAAGAIVGVGTVMATLKVGLSGVSDGVKLAFSETDPKKFAAALAKLPPEVQKLTLELTKIRPQWEQLRTAVQKPLFAGIAAEIGQLANTYLPVLRTGMVAVATSINGVVKEFAAFAKQKQTISDVGTAFSTTATLVNNLKKAVQPILSILRDVGTVGLQALTDLTGGVGKTTQKWAAFITQARETGKLREWINGGIQGVKDLAAIVTNVGAIFKSVFTPLSGQFNASLGSLRALTEQMKVFVQSADVQGALKELGIFLQTTLRTAIDTVKTAWQQFYPAFQAALPFIKAVASAFHDGLITAMQILGPILTVVGTALSSMSGFLGPLVGTVLAFGAAWKLLTLAMTPITGIVKTVSAGVTAVGSSLTATHAAVTTAGTKVATMGTQFTAAGGGVKGFGAVATSVGTSIKTGLTSSLSGASAMLGGPFGIALAGASLLMMESSQRQAEFKANVDSVAGSLNQQTGAWTANTPSVVASTEAYKQASAAGDKLGISNQTLMAAIQGNGPAMDQINAKTKESAGTFETWFGTVEGGIPWIRDLGGVIDPTGKAASDLSGRVAQLDATTKAATTGVQAAAKAQEGLGTAVGGTTATLPPAAAGLGDVNKQLPGTATGLDTVNKALPGTATGLTGINSQLPATATGLTTANTQVTPLTAGLTALNAQLTTAGTGFTTWNTSLVTVNAQLLPLVTNLTNVNAQFTPLVTSLNTLNPQFLLAVTNLTALNAQLLPMATNLTTANAQLTPMVVNFTTLNAQLLPATTNLTTLNAQVVLLTTNLTAVNPQLLLIVTNLTALNVQLPITVTNLTSINTQILTMVTNTTTFNTQLTLMVTNWTALNVQLVAGVTNFTNIGTSLTTFGTALESVGQQMTTFLQAVQETFPEVERIITDSMNNSYNALYEAASAMVDTWQEAMSIMVDVTLEGFQALLDIVSQVADILIQYGDLFYQIGLNFAYSLAQGMLDGASAVQQAGQALGQTAVQSTQQAMMIASPSKEGIRAGQNFGFALASGMDATQTAVAASASMLGMMATASANKTLAALNVPTLSASVGGSFSGLSGDYSNANEQPEGDTQVFVQIGTREITDIVDKRISRGARQERQAIAAQRDY